MWVVVRVSDVDSADVVVVSKAVDVVMSVVYTGKCNISNHLLFELLRLAVLV